MAKKTYKTFHLKGLQILLFDKYGRQIEVNFRAGAQIDSTAKFTTSDEKVQEALESCSGFGRDYYIDSVREDAPAVAGAGKNASGMHGKKGKETTETPENTENTDETPENTDETDETPENTEADEDDGVTAGVVKVADKSDAIEWLKENYPDKGYTATKLKNKEAFEDACKECGVVFEIAK